MADKLKNKLLAGATSKIPRRSIDRTNDAAIISTNDAAFLTKMSTMEAGYFQDSFLDKMRKKYDMNVLQLDSRRRSQPVMNRGTYGRIIIKDRIIHEWLNVVTNEQKTMQNIQIISLGAGFDTCLFRLLQKFEREYDCKHMCLTVTEIDLPPVVKAKRELGSEFLNGDNELFNWMRKLNDDEEGIVCEMRNNETNECRYRYILSTCDLRDINGIEKLLSETMDVENATLLISEMSLVYLLPADSDNIIEYCSEKLTCSSNTFFNLECVEIGTEFGRQMAENVAARGSVLLGMQKYKDLQSQQERFEKLGWTNYIIKDMFSFWRMCVRGEDERRLQRIEFLDEFEELNLLLKHYCIVVASKSSKLIQSVKNSLN